MKINAKRGDILLRTGLVMGYDVLSRFLGEPYNHAGIALNAQHVHHIESNWYESVLLEDFFARRNAARGAIVRFTGPLHERIADKSAEIAEKGTYPKHTGNPFSTSRDQKTVNCNEFIYLLFKQAISELYQSLLKTDMQSATILKENYVGKELIKPQDVGWNPAAGMGRAWAYPAVAAIAEYVGSTQVSNANVQVKFEGEFKEVHYDDYDPRYPNPLKYVFKDADVVTVAFLETYTPKSFTESNFFEVVNKFEIE